MSGTRPPLYARPRHALAVLFGLAVLMNLPYLWGGFQADDILFLDLLAQDPLPFSRWLGIWSADDLPAFTNLWWADPDFSGAFWRPIPSLVIEGSLALFGETAVPLHLLSLVLHGLVTSLLYLLVRRAGVSHGSSLVAWSARTTAWGSAGSPPSPT